MKSFLKTAFVLFAICAAAAAVLAAVNQVTSPAIAEYEAGVVMSALNEVSGGYTIGENHDVQGNPHVSYYYDLLDNVGSSAGYLLGLVTSGYGGEMTVVASYFADGTLMAAKLVSDSETPGLGKKAENPSYMNKFLGRGAEGNPIPKAKSELSAVDSAAVSGASMTFGGLSRALSAGSEFVKTTLAGEAVPQAKRGDGK